MTLTDTPPSPESGAHPFDHYYKPGMALRPAPPRLQPDPKWEIPRRRVSREWLADLPSPHETDLVKLMIDHFWQGDELMDAVVTRFREIGMAQGRELLDRALDDGIDSLDNPPAELVSLFASLDNPPSWHDPKVWEQGRRLWIDCSAAGKLGMGIQDAIGTFVGAEVASATGATGRFVNDPIRRNLETIKWFYGATLPGGMERYAPAFKDTVRVRLMHAQVRAGLRRSWGNEQYAEHGNPISTSTTMGAAVTFAMLPMVVDHNHGRKKTMAEMDAVMLYWSYIAYVFGVTPDIIPTNAVDGIAMADYMTHTAGGPNEWTAIMTNAAADELGRIPGVAGAIIRASVGPVIGVIAYYSGEPLARALVASTPYRDVHIQPWIALTGIAVHANVKFRMLTDHLPGARKRSEMRARNGDPLEGGQVKLAYKLAKRAGVLDTPYTQHDKTPDTPIGCPVH